MVRFDREVGEQRTHFDGLKSRDRLPIQRRGKRTQQCEDELGHAVPLLGVNDDRRCPLPAMHALLRPVYTCGGNYSIRFYTVAAYSRQQHLE